MKKKIEVKKLTPEQQEKKHTGRVREFDDDVLHLIAREVYVQGLIRGGSAPNRIKMSAAAIDSNCQIYKASVREVLRSMIANGIITKEQLVMPDNVPVKAVDSASNGISRWIKEAAEEL